MKYVAYANSSDGKTSYPLRVRGLKFGLDVGIGPWMLVVPLEGTWIEILAFLLYQQGTCVVPLEGTWIEISKVLQEGTLQ